MKKGVKSRWTEKPVFSTVFWKSREQVYFESDLGMWFNWRIDKVRQRQNMLSWNIKGSRKFAFWRNCLKSWQWPTVLYKNRPWAIPSIFINSSFLALFRKLRTNSTEQYIYPTINSPTPLIWLVLGFSEKAFRLSFLGGDFFIIWFLSYFWFFNSFFPSLPFVSQS